MSSSPPLLVLDTGSPTVSLALGRAGELIGSVTVELRQSSERLLRSLDQLLSGAGWHLSDLGGILTLRGPGSFTGLRIGLATALGLHQALDLPATALDTLPVLAAAAELPAGQRVTAAVNALRGHWMAQRFELTDTGPKPLDEPSLRSLDELTAAEISLISFSVDRLGEGGIESSRLLPAPPLAQAVIERWLPVRPQLTWDPATLIQPVYFRPPAATPPKRPSTRS